MKAVSTIIVLFPTLLFIVLLNVGILIARYSLLHFTNLLSVGTLSLRIF
jgi:hypothetical protein